MNKTNFNEIIRRSKKIRELHHQAEKQHHGSEWTIEEDALAFLTNAGLVGRYTMSQQGRWPKENTYAKLGHKLGECIWWLVVLADRMNIDMEEALERFLSKTEKLFEK